MYAEELGKLINVEQRINQCRTERTGAKPWKWESDELLSMTAFVRHQSVDLPMAPVVDRAAGLAWTPATLREYLRSPQSVVSGTSMPFGGIADAGVLDALMAYLERATARR